MTSSVPGVGGAIIAKDVDLELLGPGGLAELGGEGEAALRDVVVLIFPPMALSAMFDAGACILVETVVEVVAQIHAARGG